MIINDYVVTLNGCVFMPIKREIDFKCDHCCFSKNNCVNIPCLSSEREDGVSVIWLEVPEYAS